MNNRPAVRAYISKLTYVQWTCIVIHLCVISFLLWFVFIDPDNGMIWEWGPSRNLRMLGESVDTWAKYSFLLLIVAVTRCTEDIIISMLSNDIDSRNSEYLDIKQNPIEAYRQSRLQKAYIFIMFTMFLKSVVILQRVDLALISMVISIISVWLTGLYFSKDGPIDADDVLEQ